MTNLSIFSIDSLFRLKGPLGKLSIYILSTLYTDGAFFPTNATIDFIRRKVLNSQQGQTDNSRLVTSKKAMRTSAIRNSPLRVSRTNIGELTRTTPPDRYAAPHDYCYMYLCALQATFYICSPNTPVFSSAHLPSFFQGAYRPKSIWEVCKLIRDLTYIAKLHPEVLDDSTPPNASVLMTLYSNKYMSSRRLRVKHTNSSGSMSIGTDSTKAIIPLSPPTTLTPKGKGHKKMQKSPSNSSKQANKQTSKGGKPSNTSLLVGIQSSSSKIGPMENLEERTDDTDDDTQSTHTDSSRGSSVVLRMPSEDVSESSKKPGGDSKRSSGSRGQSKTGKLAELKRENSLTKKPLTKTPSGKAHATGAVAPKATANSPSNAPQSTSPSLNSTHNNSNQNSSSSLLVPPMLGDKSSRQASMKRRGESSRSLCDDNPAPTLSKSQGSSSRSMSTDKDGTKEKPALALSVRSNSRLNRLPSRANSSSSVQESSAEYEESANLSSSRVLSRESLPSSPMRDSIEAAMPTIVAEMEKAPVADIVNEVLPEPIAGEVLERHATEKDLSDVRATLDQLIESVVVRDAKDGLASIYKSSPWILQTLVSHEAEGVVEAIVVQTLQSLVDRADQSILTSPGRHTSTREVDEGLDQVKSVGSMTVDVVSSVLESSVDSLVFKITGSPPKPKLRLDTSYSANMESTLSHTFALSDCSTTDYTTDTDTPFKHLKDTLGHIQSQFSNPNSPSKLSREQVHALLPLDSMVQEEVVSQAVSNLLAMQGLSIVVDPFDHLAAGTEHHDMQSFVFIENDEEMDGESVGHVSSVSSVDWDLPDDVINSLLGTD
ncbi:hypothetical protein EON65_19250 [archaeon]|nr:MAG: hypothetical protein EON65_19250 [archaeon]